MITPDRRRFQVIAAAFKSRSLEEARRAPQPGAGRNWRQESLTALTEYIVDTHHFTTRRELDRLESLFDRVCSRHGENHPKMFEAQKTFYQLKQDLIPHMLKLESESQDRRVKFRSGIGNYPQM